MIAIVQARTNSSRLPGKILKKIKDKTLIGLLIYRLKKAKKIKKIIVATSNSDVDNKLVKILLKKKIKVFRGNLKDVVDRLYKASAGNKFFIRINGDSPLIDPFLIDQMIKAFNKIKKKNYDIFTNTQPRSFPKGQSIEIIRRNILKENYKRMNLIDKEHVTRFFYRNKKKFKIKNFKNIWKIFKIKFAIDTKKDLANLVQFTKNRNIATFTIFKK